MSEHRKITVEDADAEVKRRSSGNGEHEERSAFRVKDRRFWAQERNGSGEEELSQDVETVPDSEPATGEAARGEESLAEQYRRRAEAAERKLQDVAEAYRRHQEEMEAYRQRLDRDMNRKADLRFGALVGEFLQAIDDLELAMEHGRQVPQAAALVEGVAMVRDQFLKTLERSGVERIEPTGEPFDPNIAEAVRVDVTDDPEMHQKVVETLRPGYRLGDQIIRAARVAVARYPKRPEEC